MHDKLQLTVFSLIEKLLREQSKDHRIVTLDAKISELGLSSMAFAELVSQLEEMYEVDPFDDELSITDIVSVRDLVSAYQRHVAA